MNDKYVYGHGNMNTRTLLDEVVSLNIWNIVNDLTFLLYHIVHAFVGDTRRTSFRIPIILQFSARTMYLFHSIHYASPFGNLTCIWYKVFNSKKSIEAKKRRMQVFGEWFFCFNIYITSSHWHLQIKVEVQVHLGLSLEYFVDATYIFITCRVIGHQRPPLLLVM